MKSQTEGVMSMGLGVTHYIPSEQKLNTKISTEVELVGASDYRPYNLLSTTLNGLGFLINPYYRCFENKVIYGTQCTIAWYVDENKLSHKHP